jgi:hypothetical protein
MKTTNNRVFTETVLIENSDERLAAVEEAKRTGQPFQSVGANKAEIVPVVVAQQIMDEAAQEGIYVGAGGRTFAAHLESYHDKLANEEGFVARTNEEKAAAHAAYSAEFVRARNEEEDRVKQLMKEGYEPSLAVQQANFERALEHEEKSRGFGRLRAERNDDPQTVEQVEEYVVEAVNAAASMEEAIAAARAASTVPDVSESYAKEELETKDKIVEAVESFEDHAKDAEALKDKDHPAVEILEAAGSPEELRESTGLAQAAAQNPAADQTQLKEVAKKTKAKARSGKKSLTEANAEAVEEVAAEPADEMHENPTE